MTLSIFDPDVKPDLGSGLSPDIRRGGLSYHAGYDEIRNDARYTPDIARLSWSGVEEADWEYIVSFLTSELRGTNGPFIWEPFDKVPSPTGCEPVLEQFSGGALGARDCYVKFSWYTTTGQTLPSQAAMLSVSANYYLRVRVPPIPAGATGFKVYGDDSGIPAYVLQASVSTGVEYWEQSTTFAVGTSPPSTVNTLTSERIWVVADGPTVKRSTQSPLLFDIQATFLEQLF